MAGIPDGISWVDRHNLAEKQDGTSAGGQATSGGREKMWWLSS